MTSIIAVHITVATDIVMLMPKVSVITPRSSVSGDESPKLYPKASHESPGTPPVRCATIVPKTTPASIRKRFIQNFSFKAVNLKSFVREYGSYAAHRARRGISPSVCVDHAGDFVCVLIGEDEV